MPSLLGEDKATACLRLLIAVSRRGFSSWLKGLFPAIDRRGVFSNFFKGLLPAIDKRGVFSNFFKGLLPAIDRRGLSNVPENFGRDYA